MEKVQAPVLAFITYSAFALPLVQAQEKRALPCDTKISTKSHMQTTRLLEEGNQLFSDSKFAEAEDKFRQAALLSPESIEIKYRLGLSLVHTEKYNEAIGELKQVVKEKPTWRAAWIYLGKAYYTINYTSESLNAYKEALRLEPNSKDEQVLSGLISTLEDQRKDELAKTTADDYFSEVTRQNIHWPPEFMPLTVYIEPGDKVSGFNPIFVSLLKQCFQDWASVSNGKISFIFVNDSSKARIKCRWIDDPQKSPSKTEGGHVLITPVFHTNDIKTAEIFILTILPTKHFPLFNTANIPLSDTLVRKIDLRLIGRVLGMFGYSTNHNDIMFRILNTPDISPTLSARDGKTLVKLYSTKSHVALQPEYD